MSENIFNQENPVQTPGQNSSVQNPNDALATMLQDIKNERGEPKYRDVQTAIEALRHSQEFIPQLKEEKERLAREASELRSEVERLRAIEDTVTKLTSGNALEKPAPQVAPQTLNPEEVAKLVEKTLTQREVEVQRKTNLQSVVSTMQQSFGDKAEETFYQRAKELGLSVEAINNLAASSPTAALKLFGIGDTRTKQNLPSPTKPSVNADAFKPQQETFIGRNQKPVILGSTTQELMSEMRNAHNLVEELHSQGHTVHDLTDPKVYFKHFG